MTNTAIAAEIHQALDAHRHFTSEITLHAEFPDLFPQPIHFRIGKILNFYRSPDTGSITNFLCSRAANAINCRQCNLGMLVVGDINACDTGHMLTYFSSLK